MFLKIFFEFSRTKLLHLLRDAFVVHDEEDTSRLPILHNRRKNVPGSTSVQILFPVGPILGEEPASSLRGFALAFDRLGKSFASNLNAHSSN